MAVIAGEPVAEAYLKAMVAAPSLSVSAAGLTEALIVVEARQGPEAATDLGALLAEFGWSLEQPVRPATAALSRAEQPTRASTLWVRGAGPSKPSSAELEPLSFGMMDAVLQLLLRADVLGVAGRHQDQEGAERDQ